MAQACCFWYGDPQDGGQGWVCQYLIPQHCLDAGGIPGPDGSACENYDCATVPCSCCLDGSCYQNAGFACIQIGGDPRGPAGCPDGICDEDVFTGACCDQLGECIPDQTIAECEALGGLWHGPGSDCEDVICIEDEGCREPREPYYMQGDKRHSLDMCGTAIVGLTKVEEGYSDADYPVGSYRFITLHETRNTQIPEADDPCRLHWLDLMQVEDGSYSPMMCSDHYEQARYNEGFLSKVFEDDPASEYAEPGEYVAVVGVENPRLWAAEYNHTPVLCGVYT